MSKKSAPGAFNRQTERRQVRRIAAILETGQKQGKVECRVEQDAAPMAQAVVTISAPFDFFAHVMVRQLERMHHPGWFDAPPPPPPPPSPGNPPSPPDKDDKKPGKKTNKKIKKAASSKNGKKDK